MPLDAANPYQPPRPGDDGVLVAQLVHASDGLTINYQNTIDDYVAFSLHHNLHSPSQRRQRLRLRVVLAAVLLAAAWAVAMMQRDRDLRWLLGGGYLVFGVLYLLSQPVLHR